jgi:hypothetical protein
MLQSQTNASTAQVSSFLKQEFTEHRHAFAATAATIELLDDFKERA